MLLVPINGCVLIELADQYEFVSTPDKQYDTKTNGFVRAGDHPELIGKRVWFNSYQDDIKIDRDGKTFTFVKFDELRGYDDEDSPED